MNPYSLLAFIALAALSNAVHAENSDILIERGGTKLELSDMDGRMERFPREDRASFAFRPENLGRLMDQLLVNRQLAQEAKTLKLDQKPEVQRDLALAVEEVLAIHRLNALGEQTPPDFNQLALEQYRADTSSHVVPQERVVQHILIKTEGRTESEAESKAWDLHGQAVEPGADFQKLIDEHSEDDGKAENRGRYTLTRPGVFVPEFEAAAGALAAPGDISEPVKTRFGYHLIRLVEAKPERQLSFDEVKTKLIDAARLQYQKNLRESHLSRLRSMPENGNQELLLTLPERYGAPRTSRPDMPAG